MATVQEIVLNVDSLTLGDMEAAEKGSGRSITELLTSGPGSRRMLAVFLHEFNSSGQKLLPRELWQKVGSLRLSDVPFSDLPSPPDGDLAKSGD